MDGENNGNSLKWTIWGETPLFFVETSKLEIHSEFISLPEIEVGKTYLSARSETLVETAGDCKTPEDFPIDPFKGPLHGGVPK